MSKSQYEQVKEELMRLFEENPSGIYSVRTRLSFQKPSDKKSKYKCEKGRVFNELLEAGLTKIVDFSIENGGAPAPCYQNIKGPKPVVDVIDENSPRYEELNLYTTHDFCLMCGLTDADGVKMRDILDKKGIGSYAVKTLKRYSFHYRKIDLEDAKKELLKNKKVEESSNTTQLTLDISKPTTKRTYHKKPRKVDSILKVQTFLEQNPENLYSNKELSKCLSLSKGTIKVVIKQLLSERKAKVVKTKKNGVSLTPFFQGMNGNLPELDVIILLSERYYKLKLMSMLAFKEKYSVSASQLRVINKKIKKGTIVTYVVKSEQRGYFWNYKEDELVEALNATSNCKSRKTVKKRKIQAIVQATSQTIEQQAVVQQPVIQPVTQVPVQPVTQIPQQPTVQIPVQPVLNEMEAPMETVTPPEKIIPLVVATEEDNPSFLKKLCSFILFKKYVITIAENCKKKMTISNSGEDSIKI